MKFFQKLFHPSLIQLKILKPCLLSPITLAKVSQVVKAIKNNKSAGPDGIVGKLIEYGGKPMCQMLLAQFTM